MLDDHQKEEVEEDYPSGYIKHGKTDQAHTGERCMCISDSVKASQNKASL